jgi:hypothetical protein
MIAASCHCGRVSLEIETAPAEVTDCTCSICRRYGVLWAYYSPRQVRISGETETYMWGEKSIAAASAAASAIGRRCIRTGIRTAWA